MGETRIIDKITAFKPGKKLIIPLSLLGLILVGITANYTISRNRAKPESSQTVAPPAPIKAVSALGRIEPQGEVIRIAPTPDLGGSKIAQLLVKQGDRVRAGQIIALLDNQKRAAAAVELARQDVKVAEADLAIVKAGAKQGDIDAQTASIRRTQAELKGEIAANNAEVARLQAQLQREQEQNQAEIERATAELRNADSEFQRYEKLATDGVISDSQLDSRRLTLETAQKRLAAAKANKNKTIDTLTESIKQAQAVAKQNINTLQQQINEAEATLNSVAEVRDVDVIKAQAEVDRALAALKQAQEDLELTKVKAPTDGQIIQINAYPGEVVPQNEGIVEFAQTEQMLVVAEVYESDISKVKLGQPATITSEAGSFEGKIKGTVSQIGLKIGNQEVLDTDPAADVDSRVVEVKIKLDPADSERVAHLTNSKAIVNISVVK